MPNSRTSTRSSELVNPEPSQWHIFKAIEHLETCQRLHEYQEALTDQVLAILRVWARAWAVSDGEDSPQWQRSLLNKRSFLHEVEECMVALYYLDRWRKTRSDTSSPFVAVDCCGGKGIFSLFLQYFAALYWEPSELTSIILLEKVTSEQVNWDHLRAPSAIHALDEGRGVQHPLPPILIWENTSLHEYDLLVERFSSIPEQLAFTGIHLCKTLTPAMIGLVNLLGSTKCPYCCVAPCCLPRVVLSAHKHLKHAETQGNDTSKRSLPTFLLPVWGHETAIHRQERLKRVQEQQLRKTHMGSCYLCHASDHWFQDCSLYDASSGTSQISHANQLAAAPCWKCGKTGHFKSDCPNTEPTSLEPPLARQLVVDHVVSSVYPLWTYCELLLPAFLDQTMEIIEADLQNERKHQASNWNSRRKSLFIVTAT